MKKITPAQKDDLRSVLLSNPKATIKAVSEATGIPTPVVCYYKGKWGLSKKRRAKRGTYGKKSRIITGAEIKSETPTSEDILSLAAFKKAYERLSVFGKANMLGRLEEWISDEAKKINSLK